MNKFVLGILAAILAAPAAAGETAAPDGKALFAKSCASCHGKEAKGNPAMAKMFKVDAAALDLTDKDTAAKDDKALADVTRTGKGKMPSYKAKFKDAEVDALVGFIRSLGPKKE